MASVKVAVRVRPFNQRELDLDCKLVIDIDGKKTKIFNSKVPGNKDGATKEFTFDHSYWSFDADDPHFAAQEQVFDDLGTEVVDNAFQGYNACVFAYGQTGSGKTFTMMGSPENQGLIPRICKSMFERMHVGKEAGASYRTEVSYLEIYNEKVKDLLQSDSSHSLRVRAHPTLGPYVQSLSQHLVSDYPDIQEWMKRGNVHRTTARTNMNDTSSRSHAIFTITFVQAEFSRNNPTETVSKIHLVDLAGSERADATGATGERLKEGAHINKSLVTLGLVISSLAKLSSNPNDPAVKRNSTFIPYRDSVLTWLLKDSLGGNSKTIMIAAISPADVNYEETLSTLRYANRAKNIINKPTINEDPNVTLIRTLRDEINKLKTMLGGQTTSQVPEKSVLAQLQLKEAREKALTEEWTEKWRETKQILEEQSDLGLRKSGVGIILDSDRPHLVGIDDDLLSTGVTFYHLKDGETLIGTDESEKKQDIELSGGGGIIPEHCSVILRDNQAWLHPRPMASCLVNGQPVDKPVRLSQGCIIVLGRNNMFRFNDPAEAAALRKTGSRSYLNLSTLSLLYSSTTDLGERTLSNENLLDDSRVFDDRDGTAFFQSSPKSTKTEEKGTLEDVKEIWEIERLEMEAEYEAHKNQLVADWEQLERKHNDDLAELVLRKNELENEKKCLENTVQDEGFKVDSVKKEIIALEATRNEKRLKFEEMIQQQMEILKSANENVALALDSKLSNSGLDDLLPTLKSVLHLIPNSMAENKTALLRLISEYGNELSAIENSLKKICQENEPSNGTSVETGSMRSLRDNLSLPLKELEENPSDSGLGSGQTESSLADPLSPTYVSPGGAIKRRNRGSDSSEDEWVSGRQKSRFTRSRPLSKSCRAIYDEVDIGDAVQAMKELYQKVTEQKQLIMESLENDCSKEEINVQICELQDLQRQYVRLEAILELRRDNALPKMHGNQPESVGRNALSSPRITNLARSMPSLRPTTEQWFSWVRVPSFVLRGVGRQARYEYEVRLYTEEETWVLMRRYQRFRELHLSMCAKYGRLVEVINFPPRQWLPFNKESIARKRRTLLELYLMELINVCSMIRGCPLYGCDGIPSRHALIQFSPFFCKGLFEPGKYGTC